MENNKDQTLAYAVGYSNSEPKKIIGYLAPHDMFGDRIKKGDIFKRVLPGSNMYRTKDTGATQYSLHLPGEIVEKWQPVFEPKVIRMTYGVPAIEVTITNNKEILAGGKKWSIEFVKSLNSRFERNGYTIYSTGWKIGCSIFSEGEIHQIIEIYKDLNN